jgi:hypothetical protein
MRTVHLKQKHKEKEFFCNLCAHKFDRNRKLIQHMEKAHEVVVEADDLND